MHGSVRHVGPVGGLQKLWGWWWPGVHLLVACTTWSVAGLAARLHRRRLWAHAVDLLTAARPARSPGGCRGSMAGSWAVTAHVCVRGWLLFHWKLVVEFWHQGVGLRMHRCRGFHVTARWRDPPVIHLGWRSHECHGTNRIPAMRVKSFCVCVRFTGRAIGCVLKRSARKWKTSRCRMSCAGQACLRSSPSLQNVCLHCSTTMHATAVRQPTQHTANWSCTNHCFFPITRSQNSILDPFTKPNQPSNTWARHSTTVLLIEKSRSQLASVGLRSDSDNLVIMSLTIMRQSSLTDAQADYITESW